MRAMEIYFLKHKHIGVRSRYQCGLELPEFLNPLWTSQTHPDS